MDSPPSSPWRPGPILTGFLVASGVGVVLGLIGPFGSYLNAGPLERIAYWTGNLWGGWLLFGLAMPRLARLASHRGWRPWLWIPPAVAILAIAPALASRFMAVRMWPVTLQVGPLEWYGQCLLVSALATGLILWRTGLTPRPGPGFADPRDRLPPELGRDVRCLQMEDHYVRIHTRRGSALVLMSMSQAVAGLKDVEGLQVHRSWWVARQALDGVIEDGRNLRLHLGHGLIAPVARARVAALRDAGWL